MNANYRQLSIKLTLFFCLLFTATSVVLAQQKALLTKEETINYLTKKLNEALDHRGFGYYLKQSNLSIKDCFISYYALLSSSLKNHPSTVEAYNSASEEILKFKFNPMHIKLIEIDSRDNDALVGRMAIRLISKTGQLNNIFNGYVQKTWQHRGAWNGNGYPMVTDYNYQFEETSNKTIATGTITFFFLKSDPENFNKIKRALEHLRDLCKAEDDPFGQ